MPHLLCNTEFFDLDHHIKSAIGVNAGVPAFRVKQVESVGDYSECAKVENLADFAQVFRLLFDKDHCDNVTLRVDISTNDGACVRLEDCNQKEMTGFQAFLFALGRGADGAPVLRIMQSSDLS
jgi:hypothetical protein